MKKVMKFQKENLFFRVMIAVFIATMFVLFFYTGKGRIDVYPYGDRGAHVEVIEHNSNSYNPGWCQKDTGSCTVINLSNVNLFYSSNRSKIKAFGNGKLTFSIRGIHRTNKDGQIMPVYNTYKNFRINGKKIASNDKLKNLWHNNPYAYSMDVKNGDVITLEYQNRFVPSGNDWLKIGLMWLISFLISLFSVLKFSYMKFKQIIEHNWLEDIKKFYLDINPIYRRSFWMLFVITNIVFGFHTINFLWGNHDWVSLVWGKSLTHSMFEGRYGAFVVSEILTGNLYLPIISALLAFAALSLSAVLLAIYWKIPKVTAYFVIFGLILNITPYTLSWLWYAHWAVNIFFGRLFIFTGFILSDKIVLLKSLKKKILMNVLLIALFNFALSIYPSFIGTFVMVLAGRILIEMLNWHSLKYGLLDTIKQNKFSVINILIAVILYKIIFGYMKYASIIAESYFNIQTTPLAEMPEKFLFCIKSAWIQFTNWSMPFYPDILTKLFLVLSVISLVQILLSQRSWLLKLQICTAFILALFCTKTVAFISSENSIMYVPRVDFCGYVLFTALIIALSLKIGGILQNIKILTGLFIIYLFLVNDLHQQSIWKYGLDAEKMILNRIQNRIEMQEYFDKKKEYLFIHIGDPISARKKYYRDNNNKSYMDFDLLGYSFTPRWEPYVALNFYNHNNIKRMFKCNEFTNPEFMSVLKRLDDAGLLKNAKAWPAQNSIIVYEDIILVIMDEKDLQKAKQLLAEQAQKEQQQKKQIIQGIPNEKLVKTN